MQNIGKRIPILIEEYKTWDFGDRCASKETIKV